MRAIAAVLLILSSTWPCLGQAIWGSTGPFGPAVAWWKICGDISAGSGCVPTSSTTVYDSTGNGNTGTWSGAQSGTSFWYSAATVYPFAGAWPGLPVATLISGSSLVLPSVFTVSAIVKSGGTQASFTRIFETSYITGVYLGADTTGTQYQAIINNSSLSGCVGGSITAGTQQKVTVTYDGTVGNLYVNDILVAGPCTVPTFAGVTSNWTIGNSSGGISTWIGLIGNVQIYNRVVP